MHFLLGEKPLIKNTCSKNKMLSLKGQIMFYLITNITPQDNALCKALTPSSIYADEWHLIMKSQKIFGKHTKLNIHIEPIA